MSVAVAGGAPWVRHVIDDSSQGADGVRLADADGDGFLDIATGWEEGGVVRVYLNPGPLRARRPWPSITVGKVRSPEDAVLVDLDNDGAMDVVSSCEGDERSIYVHWAPSNPSDYAKSEEWITEALPASRGLARWMFALPLEVDFRRRIDLVAGGKDEGAEIGWFEAARDARELTQWTWHGICQVGWTMSLVASDMDGDGDFDVLASDRVGRRSGTLWLENPGPGPKLGAAWTRHQVGATGEEVMFLTEADLDVDGQVDVLSAVRPSTIYYHRRLSRNGTAWEQHRIRIPVAAGTLKAVQVGDIDLDGKLDIVFTCEGAAGALSGVMYLSYKGSIRDEQWRASDVSGPEGVKFDRLELIDLDGDGDLDILTCEESANLGVIWYENPAR